MCAFASECGKVLRAKARNACVRKGTCSLSDTEGNAKVFAFVSTGVDTKANTGRGGALERGHGAPLERLAQPGDALGVVGTVTVSIEATQLVVAQAAKRKGGVFSGGDGEREACQRVLTQKQTLGWRRTIS